MGREDAGVEALNERIFDPYYRGRLDESLAVCAEAAWEESQPNRIRWVALDMWAWTVLCEVEAGERSLAQWLPPIEDALAEARRLGGRRVKTEIGRTRTFLECLSDDPAPAALRLARTVHNRGKVAATPGGISVQLELALCFVTAAARTGRWLQNAENMYGSVAKSLPDHCRLPAVRRHLESALGRPVQPRRP